MISATFGIIQLRNGAQSKPPHIRKIFGKLRTIWLRVSRLAKPLIFAKGISNIALANISFISKRRMLTLQSFESCIEVWMSAGIFELEVETAVPIRMFVIADENPYDNTVRKQGFEPLKQKERP